MILTKQLKEGSQHTIVAKENLLETAILCVKKNEQPKMEEMLQTLTDEALKGTIIWDRNLIRTLTNAINRIDELLSVQLSAILQHESLKQLEGSWRGLKQLTVKSRIGSSIKLKVLNISKQTLCKDLQKSVEFDQSLLFKKVYEEEFATPGGEPYGILLGDYEFTNHPDDIEMLGKLSNTSAAAFCPFITAAGAEFFGFENWSQLSKPRDLEKIFHTPEYIKWQCLRESDDARFIVLTMPRVLARLPYGAATQAIDEFNFEELTDSFNASEPFPDPYCWTNAAYLLAERMTNAFSKYGWCTAIRGVEGGGKVEGLPLHVFSSDDGDIDSICPTEIGITDRREAELSRLGFLPICHYKNTDYAVFFGSQSIQKPLKYDRPEANTNAAISTRLPYIMATSRFAHYLKIMARDKVGSFVEVYEVEAWLNRWISNYVNGNADSGQEMKAKYPLAEARIQVEPIKGKSGAYHAIAWLRPWLQLEELTTAMRLVARIPEMGV
jgi:type VI secretion system protein ImpC